MIVILLLFITFWQKYDCNFIIFHYFPEKDMIVISFLLGKDIIKNIIKLWQEYYLFTGIYHVMWLCNIFDENGFIVIIHSFSFYIMASN